MQLEIARCLEYRPKRFNLQSYNAQVEVNASFTIDPAI